MNKDKEILFSKEAQEFFLGKEKYFTPDISDIRVGFECEIKTSSGWVPCTMDFYDLQMMVIDNRPDWYRVPYLTKEQIETEGWVELNKDYTTNEFVKGAYSLDYDFLNRVLRIYISDNFETSGYDRQFFEGQCKDINTFRYICKLLEI